MRKEIHLQEFIVEDLKKLAHKSNKSVKRYMEDVIVSHVRQNKPNGEDVRGHAEGRSIAL